MAYLGRPAAGANTRKWRVVSLHELRLRMRHGRALLAKLLLPHAGGAVGVGEAKWRHAAGVRSGGGG